MKDVELCKKVRDRMTNYDSRTRRKTKPVSFVGFILIFLLVSFSFSKEVPFTQEDRDRLIRVETKVDVGFQQIDKRFEQIDKRFELMDKKFSERFEQIDKRIEQVEKRISDLITFIWILAGVFVGIVGITISFALWDRRTMIRPFEDKTKKIESELSDTKKRLDSLVDALKELSKKDKEVENLLKKFNLM